MRSVAVFSLAVSLMVIGCGNNSIVGKYRIEQIGEGFAANMGELELDLKEDKTYVISAGQAQWFVGTWTLKDDQIEISSSNNNIGTTFKVWKGKLFPYANGREVPGWSWVR